MQCTVRISFIVSLLSNFIAQRETREKLYFMERLVLFIRPFEKRSYYVIPLGVRPSVGL